MADINSDNDNGEDDHVDDNQDLIKAQDYDEEDNLPRFTSSDMSKIVAKPSGNMVRLRCQATGKSFAFLTEKF